MKLLCDRREQCNAWKANQTIKDGRFAIETTLGGGGFGVTYRARENTSKKIVAIKTLNNFQQTKEDFDLLQEKFVNEALRLARCSHPHIVKVHELIQDQGLWGMVMEYVEGKDLAQHVENQDKLGEKEALKYIEQIGGALEYVHQQNLLHRDLKPHNIILRNNGAEAILIDFGLAREFNLEKTGSMSNSMTPAYAPIEQYARKGHFGPYTDVYALAATLYNLLTAQEPIPAKFRKLAPLPAPNQLNEEISDRVNDVILQGMEIEPEGRPSTIKEWLELLGIGVKKANPIVSFANSSEFKKFDFEVVKVDSRGKIVNREERSARYLTLDLGNNVGLDLVYIPDGKFVMGASVSEKGSRDNERPQHEVRIQSFLMGKYPVTQEQWEAVMGNNPSCFKGKKRPVECVSWEDCVNFCKNLSQKIGKQVRLPSESEWEYACRAGTNTPFYFGETITTELANYNGDRLYGNEAKGVYRKQTTDVGIFESNNFGLYDLHGNIWE